MPRGDDTRGNRRPQSARERYEKKRSPSSSSSYNDDDDEEEVWVEPVDNSGTVEEAMKQLWTHDPETFYIYGERIMKMIEFKLQRGWTRPVGAD